MMQIPYRDPEAMKRYNGKGTLLTLGAGQNASVHLSPADLLPSLPGLFSQP